MEWRVCRFDELSLDELYSIMQLRSEVFVVEQDCAYQDLDGKDKYSIHLCCFVDSKLIAYARIVAPGDSYAEKAIGRVVVSKSYRLRRVGNELMKIAIRVSHEVFGKNDIRISAQSHLEKFYSGLGFIATGKEYIEDGLPHIEMLMEYSKAEK